MLLYSIVQLFLNPIHKFYLKMTRTLIKFSSQWLNEDEYKGKLIKISDNIGKCIIRNININCGYIGKKAIINHFRSTPHKSECGIKQHT